MPHITGNARPPHFSGEVRLIPDAIALVYDLADFARFANQPDAIRFVPTFLNGIIDAIDRLIEGGPSHWEDPANDWVPITGLIHRKFLGDGELLLFENDSTVGENYVIEFLNRFFNFQEDFGKFVSHIREQVPLGFLPSRIRFGVSRGSLLELTNAVDDSKEYLGVCINLASRLQRYCPEVNVLASARILLKASQLEANKYVRVTATKIRGFEAEDIIVDKETFDALPDKTRTRLFA